MRRLILALTALTMMACAHSRPTPAQTRAEVSQERDLDQAIVRILTGDQPAEAPKADASKGAPHWPLIDVIDDSDVKSAVQALGAAAGAGAKRAVLVIDSNGGSVYAAHRITMVFDAAREHGVQVDCVVDGRGWSAATYVLASCDKRYMTKRSTLMYHEPSLSGVDLSAEQARSGYFAGLLDVLARAMAYQEISRMHLTMDEFLAHVAHGHEWWLGQEEALKVGAVDAVVDSAASVYATP